MIISNLPSPLLVLGLPGLVGVHISKSVELTEYLFEVKISVPGRLFRLFK